MSNLAIVFFALIFGLFARADFDLNAYGGYRTFPSGGTFGVQGGYNTLLWGKAEKGNPWFGYVRPGAEAASAITYNSGAAFIEIFPVGFWGLKLAHEIQSNKKDYSSFDCVSNSCQGVDHIDTIESRMAVAFGDFFLIFKGRREWHHRLDTDMRPFVEPGTGLVLDSSGRDAVNISQLVGGYTFSQYKLVTAYVTNQAVSDAKRSSQLLVGATLAWQDYTFFASVGRWSSDMQAPTGNLILSASWTPFRGLGLF